MQSDPILTWFDRLVRIHQWGQAEQLIGSEARERWRTGKRRAAVDLCRDCAQSLLAEGGVGEAADLYTQAASWLMDIGEPEEASALYGSFAGVLLSLKMFGWAASRYYDAAMVHIAGSKIGAALKILEDAEPLFRDNPGERYWQERFRRDIEILKRPASEMERLVELERVLKQDGRDDWVRLCQRGIAFHATGRLAIA